MGLTLNNKSLLFQQIYFHKQYFASPVVSGQRNRHLLLYQGRKKEREKMSVNGRYPIRQIDQAMNQEGRLLASSLIAIPKSQETTGQKRHQVQLQGQTIRQIVALTLCLEPALTFATLNCQLARNGLACFLDKYKYSYVCMYFFCNLMGELERHLVLQCGIPVAQIDKSLKNRIGKNTIKTIEMLDAESYQTLIEFIRYTYMIDNSVDLEEESLFFLHRKLADISRELKEIKKLKQQNNCLSPMKRQRKNSEGGGMISMALVNKIWTQAHSRYLRDCYQKNQQVPEISKLFKEKFPADRLCWTSRAIDLRLDRLMRQAMIIIKAGLRGKLPDFVKAKEQFMLFLNRGVHSQQVRVQMIRLLDTPTDRDLIESITSALQKLQEGRRRIKYHQELIY